MFLKMQINTRRLHSYTEKKFVEEYLTQNELYQICNIMLFLISYKADKEINVFQDYIENYIWKNQ